MKQQTKKSTDDYKVFNYRVRDKTMRRFKVLASTSGRFLGDEVDALMQFVYDMQKIADRIEGTDSKARKELNRILETYLTQYTSEDEIMGAYYAPPGDPNDLISPSI